MDKDSKKINEFEDWHEPQKRAKIIVTVLVILIILEIIGYFSYYFFYLNTSNYIDKVEKYLTSNSFNNIEYTSSDNELISYIDKYLYIDIDILEEKIGIPLTNDDVIYFKDRFIKYFLDSLKEGNLETRIKGINEKEYSIKIDKETSKLVLKRLKKSIEKDDRLNKMFYEYNLRSYLNKEFNINIKIGVETISNMIKRIDIEGNNFKIDGIFNKDELLFKGSIEIDKEKEEYTINCNKKDIDKSNIKIIDSIEDLFSLIGIEGMD